MIRTFTILFLLLCAAALSAQQIPEAVQNRNLTADADFSAAMNLFSKSQDNENIFAAAAALADCPPPKSYENNLYDIVISSDEHGPRQFFAAIILTSMSADNKELLPSLQDAYQTAKDTVLKAYAAAAVSIINPADKTKSDDVISLYSYDKIFALKAINYLYSGDDKIISALKNAAGSKDVNVRKGAAQMLGTFINEKSAKILFKMLDKEKDAEVSSAIAFSISRMPQFASADIKKCLNIKYSTRPAFTCSLALGFMPGAGFEILKGSLSDANENVQINALRAAAAAAEVLSGKDTASYSSDVKFDKQNLKTLIPQIASMGANSKSDKVKEYADTAGKSFQKLM
ncbi:MAG: HEAT repeat domain-containing protein [Elusimicrobia bacterium]|nr:HEAT repeat domain-containing protein [Elusimicrobiota bacterium]